MLLVVHTSSFLSYHAVLVTLWFAELEKGQSVLYIAGAHDMDVAAALQVYLLLSVVSFTCFCLTWRACRCVNGVVVFVAEAACIKNFSSARHGSGYVASAGANQ